ncbi:hypothetical protein ABIA32_002710 [Streptacidiphilus sp. MAP12-20]|uniref:hypothetical protein n=1 Tax=Streptacidiphilus sp. MAP12-20 TaxID=3156299 RepID=UPI00351669EB
MSDHEDLIYAGVAALARKVYEVIIMASRILPVPVELPSGEVSPEQVKPSVIQLAELAKDQPMPQDQQVKLEMVALLFVGGMDLLATYDHHRRKYLAGAAMCSFLATEEYALELARWLVDRFSSEE